MYNFHCWFIGRFLLRCTNKTIKYICHGRIIRFIIPLHFCQKHNYYVSVWSGTQNDDAKNKNYKQLGMNCIVFIMSLSMCLKHLTLTDKGLLLVKLSHVAGICLWNNKLLHYPHVLLILENVLHYKNQHHCNYVLLKKVAIPFEIFFLHGHFCHSWDNFI